MSLMQRTEGWDGTAVGHGHRSIIVRAAGVVAVMALAAACGGSSKPAAPSTPSTPPPTSSSPATPSTPPAPSTPSPSTTPSGTAPADPAAATAQIKTNWETFFSPKTSLADKAKYLENGSQLTALLQGFASDPRVGQVSAVVTNVMFTSPTTATVTYTLSLQGTVVEPNATGKAVLQDGVWKVSTATLCGLVALTGNTSLPGCS